MKIFFTASSTGADDKRISIYKEIVNILQIEAHEITNYYYMKDSNPAKKIAYNKIQEKKESIYTSILKSIRSSDCLVADITLPSTTIGMQIEYALNNRIPVVCLYDEKEVDELPLYIRDYDNNLLIRKTYDDTNLKCITLESLKEIQDNKIRFNFFINFDINRYIQHISDTEGLSKAEIVRGILEDKMKNDPRSKKLKDPNSFDKYRPVPSAII